jgi:GTPase involved in cell partitioning and DNA repair
VIDGSYDDEDGRSPIKDYEVLINELKHYQDGALLKKPSLIVSSWRF